MKAWRKFIGKEFEDVTEDVISKFDIYLVGRNLQHSVTKKAIIKNGTMLQYMSGVFNLMKRKKYLNLVKPLLELHTGTTLR